MNPKYIEIVGAEDNNLKNIDVKIPLNKSTVVVGVSGSGKSTLVYDTLFNESKRAFMEHLLINHSGGLNKGPSKVKTIKNLPAAFSVSQHSYNSNPRSTIGTYTDLSDLLRGLYAYTVRFESNKVYKPNDFSANNPMFSCPTCQGIGESYQLNKDSVIPDITKTLNQHAIKFFQDNDKSLKFMTLKKYCELKDIPMDIPFSDLPENCQTDLLYSNDNYEYEVRYKTNKNRYKTKKVVFKGAFVLLEESLNSIDTPSTFKSIQKFLKLGQCSDCLGLKLKKEILDLKINKLSISEVENLSLDELSLWINEVRNSFGSKTQNIINIINDIELKLQPYINLKINYLTLSRSIPTLSGGELQRVRIASQLSNPLIGLLYIFDEPCRGLHPKDIKYIINAIFTFIKKGNTIVSIEHNDNFISQMDNKIYLGPTGGYRGGYLITEDEYKIEMQKSSLPIKCDKKSTKIEFLKFEGISKNNLLNLNCEIPRYGITAIIGASGSGKTSLMNVIYGSLKHRKPEDCKQIYNYEHCENIYFLDQKPIHSNKRSIVATYLEVFDEIRNIYASAEKSKYKKFSASHFSKNLDGGRCQDCFGQGEIKVEMSYLEDMYYICESCNGTGYKPEILEITYLGKNIFEFLHTDVDELLKIVPSENVMYKKLEMLSVLGMGYIRLGQVTGSLSGGESQRVKLAKILGKRVKSNSVFLLDEPTAGLSQIDSNKLSLILNEISHKNTVIITEHNEEFVRRNVNYLVDLGTNVGQKNSTILQGKLGSVISKCSFA
ncbi:MULTISPECIES: ATP-binding cassette domain-containing protein [unclassified Exiguobacterium]|uniref:ATP-binding cassette domain-containing protein n=1 Tax=unclassified Exiguobacterium TaxID=2644629 RepID=UPI001BEC6094|nr:MULTISPECIES: ATP-binding cassette domain-containing protein [unclassified Exiguobacterium]